MSDFLGSTNNVAEIKQHKPKRTIILKNTLYEVRSIIIPENELMKMIGNSAVLVKPI